jgi:bifunctional non-homologous end joining protein LigD
VHDDGHALYQAATSLGLEGVMAKRLDSTYEVGRRSTSWRKIKIRHQQELVVGGWTEGSGSRAGHFGALLVGYYEDDTFRYAGRVGTGFDDRELSRLRPLLHHLETVADGSPSPDPFDPTPPASHRRRVHWVRPELVVEVAFAEWTNDDRLRHPSYLGQRTDKDPHEVVREPDSSVP